jgi:hypothetical protein
VTVRIALAVVAVLVLAWLGVMERDARLQARGAAAAKPPHADLARADDDLRAARLLNPDTTPDVLRAFVQQAGGHNAAAIATLEDVVRREPDNLPAWGSLYSVSKLTDHAAAKRALAARARLDPVSARG